MRKRHTVAGLPVDPLTKMATSLVEAVAMRSDRNTELLQALAMAVGTNERAQRRFRIAVVTRLSRIEAMLTEVQGAQLAQYWSAGRCSDAQRAKWVQEVEERISEASDELGLKMVRYIYSESEESGAHRGGRRRWSGWEI